MTESGNNSPYLQERNLQVKRRLQWRTLLLPAPRQVKFIKIIIKSSCVWEKIKNQLICLAIFFCTEIELQNTPTNIKIPNLRAPNISQHIIYVLSCHFWPAFAYKIHFSLACFWPFRPPDARSIAASAWRSRKTAARTGETTVRMVRDTTCAQHGRDPSRSRAAEQSDVIV